MKSSAFLALAGLVLFVSACSREPSKALVVHGKLIEKKEPVDAPPPAQDPANDQAKDPIKAGWIPIRTPHRASIGTVGWVKLQKFPTENRGVTTPFGGGTNTREEN